MIDDPHPGDLCLSKTVRSQTNYSEPCVWLAFLTKSLAGSTQVLAVGFCTVWLGCRNTCSVLIRNMILNSPAPGPSTAVMLQLYSGFPLFWNASKSSIPNFKFCVRNICKIWNYDSYLVVLGVNFSVPGLSAPGLREEFQHEIIISLQSLKPESLTGDVGSWSLKTQFMDC